MEKAELDGLLATFSNEEDLIPALQAVQEHLGYVPADAIRRIAAHLRLPASTAFGTASFYSQFRFTPPGKHKLRVCCGTACHVRGSGQIVQALERKLGIQPGETSDDNEFSLERVACFGSCALVPVLVVNDQVHGQMTPEKTLAEIGDLQCP